MNEMLRVIELTKNGMIWNYYENDSMDRGYFAFLDGVHYRLKAVAGYRVLYVRGYALNTSADRLWDLVVEGEREFLESIKSF